ncbi:hypothetical protein SATRI_v1c01740 [Spiroplasma atrichopogonis]|nr:hypothetical protein SATRI_v1c01740 [Spiroplasma atrichopogonis]
MKKFFKEINKWRLFIIFLSIIMCVLTTTFLILYREWSSKENLSYFSIYIYFGVINFAFCSLFILLILNEVLEFIDNKKNKIKKDK